MLVYSNALTVLGKSLDSREAALRSIQLWLSYKCRVHAEEFVFSDDLSRSFSEGKRVEAWSTSAHSDDHPRINSIRFSHPDGEVAGRQWVTEVGVRQEAPEGSAEVTVLLQTNDISARVGSEAVVATRPGVVDQVLRNCTVVGDGRTGTSRNLEDRDIEELVRLVESPARRHPIVLVSLDKFSERPLVDTHRLASQLVGLAEVFLIANKFANFRFTQALGQARSAWGGAINLIFPPHNQFIPTRLLRPDAIARLAEEGDPIQHLLGLVAHATNLPMSWRHISPETVRQARLERRLALLKAARKPDEESQEVLALYEEELQGEHKKTGALEDTVLDREAQIQQLHSDVRRLRYQLSQKAGPAEVAFEPEPRYFGNLAEVAATVEEEMSDRIVLTNRAGRSIKESPYRDAANAYRAFELLHAQFFSMCMGESGREEVDQALLDAGMEYSPSMSESTMGRYVGYDAKYKGRSADFNKHIKIGSTRDPTRCFRIHFEWDAADARIVVHHAGKHLTTTQS